MLHRDPGVGNLVSFLWKLQTSPPPVGNDVDNLLRIQTPTWGAKGDPDSIKATWLG